LNHKLTKYKFRAAQFGFVVSNKVWYGAGVHQIILDKFHSMLSLWKPDIKFRR